MSTSDDKASNNSDFFEELVVEEQPNEEIEQSSPPESAMSAGFALDGALAEAASASLLISEARTADKFGFAREGEEGSGSWITNPLMLGGLGLLTGLGIWALSGGGDKNSPPELDSAEQFLSTNEDTELTITINAVDPDGDTLTYAVTTPPGHGVATVSGFKVLYAPAKDYNGKDNLVVTITDPDGQSATQAIEITVNPVNDAPKFAVSIETELAHGETYSGNLNSVASDPDGDPLTFSSATSPMHGTLVVDSDGTFTYTPTPGYSGEDIFEVAATDDKGATSFSVIPVSIAPPGLPPTGNTLTEIVVDEDSSVNFAPTIVDPDGDRIVFDISGMPDHGALSVGGIGQYTYTPTPDYNGLDGFEITGVTGDGAFTETFLVTVRPINDDPTAPAEQAARTRVDTAIILPYIATDIDGDHLDVVVPAEDSPQNGKLSANPDDAFKFIYTPSPGFTGTDTFTLTYVDGKGGSAKTSWTITVSENTPPTITTDISEFSLEEDDRNGVTITVTTADEDGDNVTVTAAASNGIVNKNADGTFTYIPNVDYWGLDSVVFTATDAKGATSTRAVLGAVTSVNDVPVQESETTTSIIVNNTDTAEFKIEFTDVDEDLLTFILDKEPGHGTVTTDVNGNYIYDPVDTYVGPDTFDIKVDDGNGGVVTYSVSVTVTGAEEVSLNGIDPSEPNGSFNAGVGSFILLLSALQVAHMIVTAFGIDDVIRISNGTPDDFALIPGGNSEDLFLESIGAPLLQKIFIPGLFAESGPPAEYTFPSIAETLGFNPFEFTVIP